MCWALQSPLTDSNRRPPLYEEGPRVKRWLSRRPVKASVLGGRGELGSSLYRLLVGGQGRLEFAPVAHLLKDLRLKRKVALKTRSGSGDDGAGSVRQRSILPPAARD
jgi:hypothetical protein